MVRFVGLWQGLPSRKDWEDVVSVIHNETEEARKRVLGWQVMIEANEDQHIQSEWTKYLHAL